MISSDLFTYDLDQHPLPPPAVELPVEDALPGAKVQPAAGDSNHHLAPHHLPLQVRVCIVLPGVIVPVLSDGRVGSQFLQPFLIVLVQAILVVVDACPERSDRNTLAVMCGSTVHCLAFTRVSTLSFVCHSHATEDQGLGSDRPCLELPQLFHRAGSS
jgi:hypothetical protein